MLPDRSILIRQKLVENDKIEKFKCDILDNFETLWTMSGLEKKKNFYFDIFWTFFSKNVLYSILVLVKCITEIIVWIFSIPVLKELDKLLRWSISPCRIFRHLKQEKEFAIKKVTSRKFLTSPSPFNQVVQEP